jgi:hypothetical protein
MLWSLIFDSIKDFSKDYIESIRDKFYDFSKQLYIFTVLSVISTIMLCFSLFALMLKCGDKLDSINGFSWTQSMTLYSFISAISLLTLYYIAKRKDKAHNYSLEYEIEKTIKKHDNKQRGQNAKRKSKTK